MLALRVITEQGPGNVALEEVPEPEGDLIIQTRAAGVSFPDLLMTQGKYQIRQPMPFTLGMEAAGDVIKAESGSGFSVGDRVMTLTFGTHAERIAALPELTFAIPDGMSYEQGASLPLNYTTALAAVERRGRLAAGESVLVHGAAGGVGTAVIQVAKALGADRVVAVVSTAAKAAVARAAGADEVAIGEDFRSQLIANVDLVIDPVGGTKRFNESLRCLTPEGRLVVVGFAAGEIPEVRVHRLLNSNVDVCGCNLYIYANDPGGMGTAIARLAELAANGGIKPIVGKTRPLKDGIAALQTIAARSATGKIILTVEPREPDHKLGDSTTMGSVAR